MAVVAIVAIGIAAVVLARRVPVPAASSAAPALPGDKPSGPPPARPEPGVDPGTSYYREGRRLLAEGKADLAVEQFEKAVAAAPGNGAYHFALGEGLQKLERTNDALVEMAAAARLDPYYWVPLARAQAKAGATADAESSFASALEADPNSVDAALEMGELLAGQNRLADAAPYFEQVVRLRPADSYAIQSLAAALAAAGESERAEKIYRKYVQANPADGVVRARLADLLATGNRTEEAIRLTHDGLAANPSAAMLQRTLGSLLERAGRSSEAVTAYREYVRLAPSAPDTKQIQERADLLSGGK